MIYDKMMYDLNDYTILPSKEATDIEHRSDINIYLDNEKILPIFVSPMSCVLNQSNLNDFRDAGFIPIIPRSESLEYRLCSDEFFWTAYSLQEFEKHYCNTRSYGEHLILIDIANGHMRKIYSLVKEAKAINKDLMIMVGNIAHPEMYYEAYLAGVDYIRAGIGGGTVCTTACVTSIFSSLPYILSGIQEIKNRILQTPTHLPLPKVIADGGLNSFDRIIKCFAFGADYVMCGKLFAQCEEACGETRELVKAVKAYDFEIPGERIIKSDKERKYYGMASKQGQIDISGGFTKCEEGTEIWVPIKWKASELHREISAALRSAMSYTNSHNLREFKNVDLQLISTTVRQSYYK